MCEHAEYKLANMRIKELEVIVLDLVADHQRLGSSYDPGGQCICKACRAVGLVQPRPSDEVE